MSLRKFSKLDMDNFTANEVADCFWWCPLWLARLLCNMAVVDRQFEKTENGYRLARNVTDETPVK